MRRFNFNASVFISVSADNEEKAMKLAWALLQRRVDKQQWGFKNSEGAEVIHWILNEELIGAIENTCERIVIDDRNTYGRGSSKRKDPSMEASTTDNDITRKERVSSRTRTDSSPEEKTRIVDVTKFRK